MDYSESLSLFTIVISVLFAKNAKTLFFLIMKIITDINKNVYLSYSEKLFTKSINTNDTYRKQTLYYY